MEQIFNFGCRLEAQNRTDSLKRGLAGLETWLQTVSPERGIFLPPPRSHLGETHANVACHCVGSATRCGHQLRVKPKVHEDGLRYNA